METPAQHDPLAELEVRIVKLGLTLLSIATFLNYIIGELAHLAQRFLRMYL